MARLISLEALLRDFHPDLLVDLAFSLAQASEKLPRFNEPIDRLLNDDLLGALSLCADSINGTNLPLSSMLVTEIQRRVTKKLYRTANELAGELSALHFRVEDELKIGKFVELNQSEAALYSRSTQSPMGSNVDLKFPSAKYDIEEAYKCLALGRATASAFHAMRVLEHGLSAIRKCLALPDPSKPSDRNWGVALGAIKAEMDKRWNSAARQGGDGHIFEGLYVSLDAIRNPWRNATMHVEAIYTEENADHILSAVGAFMQRLADRCDENGLPKA